MTKKRIIIALVFIIVVIFIPLLISLGKKSSSDVNNRVTTPANTTKTAVEKNQPKSDLTQYASAQDPKYTLYYPKNWVENKSVMSNQTGLVYLLQPQDASLPSHPHITVEVVDDKLDTVDHMTTEFRVFGYSKTTVTINGTPMTKYQRAIATAEGTLHSTAYIYQKPGSIYFFKLGYKQTQEDQQLENQLQEIVTHFTLH